MPTLETVPTSDLMIEKTRIIRAPLARCYEAWTNPEIVKRWFGPENMYCPSVSLDVRVGGDYRIDVHSTPDAGLPAAESAGRQASASGTYTKIVPNQLLQFTWKPSWNPGEDSLVTVSFRESDAGTEVTIHHERFLPGTQVEGYNKGWTGCLDKLAKLAAANQI